MQLIVQVVTLKYDFKVCQTSVYDNQTCVCVCQKIILNIQEYNKNLS